EGGVGGSSGAGGADGSSGSSGNAAGAGGGPGESGPGEPGGGFDGGAGGADESGPEGSDGPVLADSAAATTLLANRGFELADWADWGWNEAIATSVPASVALPHGGALSCRICSFEGQSVYDLLQHVSTAQLTPGVTYVASAWIRADPVRPP